MEEQQKYDYINSLIESYENFVKELTSELDNFRLEHDVLKSKITVVIQENDRISHEYKLLLETQQHFHSDEIRYDKTVMENLKKQLETVIEEKNCTTKMWQDAMTTIDRLEDELKIYQTETAEYIPKKDVTKLKLAYENKIKILERNLMETTQKLRNINTEVAQQLYQKADAVEKSIETQTGTLKIIKQLEDEILHLQNRLQHTVDEKIALEKRITTKEKLIEKMKHQNSEYRSKVQEAVQVVEAALNEKDAALIREKNTIEDKNKMEETLSQLITEAENKVKTEILIVKNQYTEKLNPILYELKRAQDEIQDNRKEIERYSAKCLAFENEIQRYQRGNLHIDDSNTSKLLLLEKNLESTFQKLLLSEKKNIQLSSQIDTIKNDMEQMCQHYEQTIKSKEIEKVTLESRINVLKTQLDENTINLQESESYRKQLTKNLEETERKLEQEIQNHEKTKSKFNSEQLELQHSYNDDITKCKDQLNLQMNLNQKWINETKIITNTFEKRILDLKVEIHKVRKENLMLKQQLQEVEMKVREYKIFLKLISKDVSKITSLSIRKEVLQHSTA